MAKDRALICEPHAALEADFIKTLGNYNIKVEKTADAHSALKLIGSTFYDIVILNYSLAENEGDEYFIKIKSCLPPQSCLIITGEDKKENYEKSMRGGAYAYLVIHPFDREKFSLMIKQALHRNHFITENIRLKRETELLRNIKNMALTISLKELTSFLLSSIIELTQCQCGFIAIKEGDKGDLVVQTSKGSKMDGIEKAIFGMEQSFLKSVTERGKPLFIEDAKKDSRVNSSEIKEEAITSLYLWPIVGEKDTFGVAVVGRRGEKKALSKKDAFYVNKLLTDSSLAIQNVLSYQKISGLTLRDDITNAYNRRFFESFMEEEIQRSRRYKLTFSIIFIDLNNFKRINELYGHSTGSRMLGAVAKRMGSQVRSVDRVVRYGGDEFCIILPETDTEGALKVAERIKKKIEGEPFRFGNIKDTYIAASFGISAYPEHGSTKKRLLSLADRAMFEAKKKKDNPITIAANIHK